MTISQKLREEIVDGKGNWFARYECDGCGWVINEPINAFELLALTNTSGLNPAPIPHECWHGTICAARFKRYERKL